MDLRTARTNRKLTQEALMDASGVDQATISAIELGRIRDPKHSTVQRLEQALGLKPGTLTFGEDAA